MVDVDKLKAIPIAEVAVALGFQLSGGMARCRLPGHDDRTPSFSIRTLTNTFHCFGCNRGGDSINLVQIMEDVDFLGACQWLGYRFGIDAVAPRRSGRMRSRRSTRTQLPIVVLPSKENQAIPDHEIFAWVLEQSPLTPSGRAYLESRNFSTATLDHFGIGQLGDERKLLQSARAHFGDERLKKSGLVGEKHSRLFLAFRSSYLLFPFVDYDNITFIQARRPDGKSEKRWLCPVGLPPPAFNLEVLSLPTSTVYICEGVTDVLSAHQLGMPAIGLVGASAPIDTNTIERLRGHNVAVLGDSDSAGAGFSQRLVRLLGGQGITAVAKPMPAGFNDLNDYLREGGVPHR